MDPAYLRDLFSCFRPVTVRRMFGGAGIYADGVMFALLSSGGTLYLKVGETNEADFLREGLPSFTPVTKGGKRAVMPYRQMPDRLFDDPEELARWAGRALAVAHRKALPGTTTSRNAARNAKRRSKR